MAKKYTLHYLNDKEFDNLPYKLAKTSFGAADEKTGNAYVRRTGIKPIDEFVTEHEIAELVAKVSPHEEDGIRYKTSSGSSNLWDNFSSLFTGEGASSTAGTAGQNSATSSGMLAGGYNTPSATGGGGASQGTPVTGSLGASTGSSTGSSLTDTFNNYQANQLGFASTPVNLGGTTSYVSPNLSTINTSSPSAQNSWSGTNSLTNMFTNNQANNANLGSNVSLGGQNYNVTGGTNGLSASPTNTTSSNLGFETPTAQNANVPLQTINQAAVSPSLQGGGEVSTATIGQNKTNTPFLESIFGKNWKQALLGTGISAIGQMAAGKTQTVNPTDSALYNQVLDRIQSGAQVELSPAQQTAITQNYDNQLDVARKNIIARFKALRPGSDIANDSQLQEALIELENDYAEQKAAAITAAQLGLTQQQTAQLSQLAALDINSLATQAGISNQEASDFKNMMASLGAMISGGGQQQQVFTQ
jgi:hypothetical protein